MNPSSRASKRPLSRFWLGLLSGLLALPAQAHMTWLLPNTTQLSGKEPVVSIDAAVSEDLFVFERGLKLDRLRITGPDGAELQPEQRSSARHRESFDLRLLKEGSYRISHTSQTLMASYRLAGGEPKRFRGNAETFAKEVPAEAEILGLTQGFNRNQTFVSKEQAGQPNFAPEGQGLELLPLGSVTDLSSGDRSRFRLLLDGKPLADASLKLLREGNRYRYKLGEQLIKSDAQGEFSVAWEEAGRYWLGVNHAPALAEQPASFKGSRAQPLRRFGLNATFEVLPK